MSIEKVKPKSTDFQAILTISLIWACISYTSAAGPLTRADVITAYSLRTETQCLRLCWYRQPCVSYSYNVLTKNENCVLHSGLYTGSTLPPSGWLSKNVDPGVVLNGCENKPCTATEVCVPAISGQYQCLALSPEHFEVPQVTIPATTEPATTVGADITTETACPDPPLLQRTQVTRTYLSDGTVLANYSCSVSTDIYVRGTTSVICTDGTWSQPTILCAPTDCWYKDPTWDGVYAGTVNSRYFSSAGVTRTCDRWDDDATLYSRSGNYDSDSMYIVDLSRSNAHDYCRMFPQYDNDYTPWCYSLDQYLAGGGNWFQCSQITECSGVPGILVN